MVSVRLWLVCFLNFSYNKQTYRGIKFSVRPWLPTEFLYFVKLTREKVPCEQRPFDLPRSKGLCSQGSEKGKVATRVGKADGLTPSFSTRVMLLARGSFQHSWLFPSLNNYSPKEKLKTAWSLHSDVFNIFATWETVENIREVIYWNYWGKSARKINTIVTTLPLPCWPK